jgi:hypothetical protein
LKSAAADLTLRAPARFLLASESLRVVDVCAHVATVCADECCHPRCRLLQTRRRHRDPQRSNAPKEVKRSPDAFRAAALRARRRTSAGRLLIQCHDPSSPSHRRRLLCRFPALVRRHRCKGPLTLMLLRGTARFKLTHYPHSQRGRSPVTGGSDGVAKAFFTNVIPVTRPDSSSCNRKYRAAIMRSALTWIIHNMDL